MRVKTKDPIVHVFPPLRINRDLVCIMNNKPEYMELSDPDERAALRRCQSGDAKAFGIIVRKYMKRAYFTALGIVGNHDDALDLSQEAFVRAYRAVNRFDLRQRFFTWYYRILRNLCLNHMRDRAKLVRLDHVATGSDHDGELSETQLADSSADPSILAERSESVENLWKAIARLRGEEREVFVLREIEGCSYVEIADRLGIPKGTVMSRLFAARSRLRKILGGLLR